MLQYGNSVATAKATRVRRPVQAGRDAALDFVKGTLVLLMVLYHWLNYFVVIEWDAYRYLRFLTPSFIFITGYLVSHVYLQKYASDDVALGRRLRGRGFKLIVLFALLNLMATLVIRENYDGGQLSPFAFFQNAYAIFITGDGRALFGILVPIGYFLLLAPSLLTGASKLGVPLPVAGTCVAAVALVASLAGWTNANVQLLAIATLGLGTGALPSDRIPFPFGVPLLVAAYALYLAAITYWDVLFPLQIVGVCLSVLLIYIAGSKAGSSGWFQRIVIQLGQYSLFAYIAQVGILQVLKRGLRGFPLGGAELAVPLAATVFLTLLAVAAVRRARGRSARVDWLYRAVFA